MQRSRIPVRLILAAILICTLLIVSLPVLDTLINPEGSGSVNSIVSAQDSPCAGCDTVVDEIQQWQTRLDALSPDASPADAARARQALDAANNRLGRCVSSGCIKAATGDQPPKSDSGGEPDEVEDTGDDHAPDSDGDGVPDDVDECPGTPSRVAVDDKGCPRVMELTAYIPSMQVKDTYSPGETVTVEGSVKDANGNAIPDVSLVIGLEGTDIPPLAGTMYDLTNYSGRLDLPKDLSEGTYTVKVTASKTGYPDVSKTTSITVVVPTITLCPSTVPGPGGDVKKTIEIKGTGFGANEPINIVLGTGTGVGSISADADGSFRVECDIPETELGTRGEKHTIEATGTVPLHTANAEFLVGPSLYDIKNVWFRWGEEKGSWPDKSTDTHRAFHHCFGGGAAANARQWRQLPPYQKQEASHFGCLACQWKTLYFFVQQGKDHNLGGWEFFPIGVIGTRLGEMGGHHAVVLYPAHGNWKTDGYVFDPHQSGKPDSWAVQHISKWDCWDRFSVSFDEYKFYPYWFGGKIVDDSFVRDYEIGCGFKDAYHYDAYEKFPDSYATEWMTPGDTEKYRVIYEMEGRTSPAGNPKPSFYLKCPVNFLVVNSAGERLGIIEDGEWVFEFKPEKLDTWPGEDNSPVWYIELPKGDVYTILITGTGSGNLEVFALLEGSRVVFKYPPVEVSAGDKFSMKLDADDPGTPLNTPSGQVSPTEIPIEEYTAIVEPTKDNRPPTASFALMPENPEVGDYIVVASTSSDPDGNMLTTSWYLDGEHLLELDNLSNWEWVDAEAGEYTLTLIVEDGKGGIDEHFTIVEVRAAGQESTNSPPTASFTLMPQNPTPDDTIVGVSTSSDPDGDSLLYSWYFNGEYDSNIGNLPEWTWPNPAEGEYTIGLVVMDGEGGTDEYSLAVTVVGDVEEAGSNSNILYFLLLLIPAAILVLIIGRRARQR